MSTPTVLPWHREVEQIASACKGHTPAPWGYDLNHTVGRHESGEWEESVCQLPAGTHKRRPTAQEKSDMALIARAPRMLQLLTELARHDPHAAQLGKLTGTTPVEIAHEPEVPESFKQGLLEATQTQLDDLRKQHAETVRLLEEAKEEMRYNIAPRLCLEIETHLAAIKHHAGGANGMMQPTAP